MHGSAGGVQWLVGESRAMRGRLAGRSAVVLATLFSTVGTAMAQQRSPEDVLGDGPVFLSTVARLAVDRNRDVLDARYQVGVAEGQVSEAWADVYPSLDLSSSYTRNVAPQVSFLPAQIFDPTASEGDFIPVQFGADNLWNLSVSAEQSLIDPRVFVGVGAASRFRGLQEEALRGRSQQVVTRVRVAVYDLLLAQEEVRLTENSIERVRKSLEETRAMQEAGLAEYYDVLRLEVELANLEPNLKRAENRRSAARRTIASEMALAPETMFDVAGELARIDLDRFDANSPANRDILAFAGVDVGEGTEVMEFVSRGAVRRSDIRQLEITETLRETEVRIEQVDYLPSVSAFGTYGLAAQQNGVPDFFGTNLQRGSTKQIGLRVSFPIFSGFRREARIEQREMALRQARTQTDIAVDQAEIQLRNLVDEVREARGRTGAQSLAVSQAGRGYEIASAQYREGLASQLELTDAEVALRQSEFNYAQAVYDYLAARARLDEAAGQVPIVDLEHWGNGDGGGH
ncbi:MAG: TolC family protein [Gemmatimonadota bacterium]|nr:TolC family protein [Gemmatimonadota bacterium]